MSAPITSNNSIAKQRGVLQTRPALPQEEDAGLHASHSLRVSLQSTQLLSLWLQGEANAAALSGNHWISCGDGTDVCLRAGTSSVLPEGLVLLDGEGEVEITLTESAHKSGLLQRINRVTGFNQKPHAITETATLKIRIS